VVAPAVVAAPAFPSAVDLDAASFSCDWIVASCGAAAAGVSDGDDMNDWIDPAAVSTAAAVGPAGRARHAGFEPM